MLNYKTLKINNLDDVILSSFYSDIDLSISCFETSTETPFRSYSPTNNVNKRTILTLSVCKNHILLCIVQPSTESSYRASVWSVGYAAWSMRLSSSSLLFLPSSCA